jgi:uncharacterized Fe-S cluster-containing radical SAM superfamily protein
MIWPVVPIGEYQRFDVRQEDLLDGGDFRKCETYRGGGGYDQFPSICEKRLGRRAHQQFIVQLYGCNLDCPYCYVTRSGVWGKPKEFTTGELVGAFKRSGQEVFHLMGGAPALYLGGWPELIAKVPDAVFHSDFLLTEQSYDEAALAAAASFKNTLFAVDIKGTTPEDYEKNTRKKFKGDLFWQNLEKLVKHAVNFYITFTNPDMAHYDALVSDLERRFGKRIMDDAFTIGLIEYDAQPFVDIRPAEVTNG